MNNQINNRLILILTFLFYFNFAQAQINTSNTPNWVIAQSYEASPDIAADEISFGLLTLLNDEQVHIPKQERYTRLVHKITDNVGIQEGSSISINYDPMYQKLFLHQITVIRNGERIDKLNTNDFQTIRQESNSENYIYDGSLNAITNLADIRNGDIVDLSYTVKGFNPIHKGHFAGATTLNDYQPVGKVHYYLISNKKLHFKVVNSDLNPKQSKYNGYNTYQWQTIQPEPVNFDENLPGWHLAYQNVFVTDFDSWADVVNLSLSIYQEDFELSKALQNKVESIKQNAPSEGERISATLKFVQDEIRYLGLESGIGAYKPFSPNKVFDQRFGDCKDKSWLMVTMLRNMGIKAYPALTSTVYGESLNQFSPTPKSFDHVVVKVIDSTDANLFYDPTISNQGGNYKTVSFPNYGKALVIKKGVSELETIESKNEDLVEVFDTFDLKTVGGPATLNVMTVYNDAEADVIRNRYKSKSLSSLSADFKSYYDNLYEDIEVIKPPEIDDDSLSNRILIEEFYKINKIWNPMVGDEDKIAADFTAYSIAEVFMSPNTKERKTPYALYYPTRKKHQVTVKLPQRWGIAKDNITIDSKDFEFSMTSKMNPRRDILYLNYEYHNKSAYVAPEDFEEYYNDIKEVEQILAYYVYIPKSEATISRIKDPINSEKLTSSIKTIFYWLVGIMGIIVLALVVFVIHSKRNSDNL